MSSLADPPLLEEIQSNKDAFQYPSSASEISAIREIFPDVSALSWEEAEHLQTQYGKNILAISKPTPWYMILFHAIVQPFNVILVILAGISAGTNDWKTFTVMMVMVSISSVLKFVQEWKSNVSAEALKNLVENYVVVMRLYRAPDYRDPTFEDVKLMDAGVVVENEIFMEDIVPGDIIKLRAGDLIPGDVQLLLSKDLFVSEAALTGESIPVEKTACSKLSDGQKVSPQVGISISDNERHKSDLCFMGSSVVSGTATAIVLRIGSKTMFGEMALKLAQMQPRNAFQQGIRQVSILFAVIMLIMMPTILILMGVLKGNWGDAFSFAIAVAVGLTPEMLPMIVNACLASGAICMSKKRTIVKKLESIVNFGSMDMLCTDKTGTLTQNKVVLVKHVDLYGQTCTFPLEMSFLNSHFQTGLRNLIDEAILEYYDTISARDRELQTSPGDFIKIDEIPFDFVRRRMSVILKSQRAEHIVVSKGALEEMLQICTHYKDKEAGTIPLTDELKQKALDLAERLNEDGLRVVAVGFKHLSKLPKAFSVADEKEMTLAGLCAFLDPPKESTRPAIRELISRGIEIKVLTGDTPVVCRKVCKEIGLPVKQIVTTKDIEGLTDDQVRSIAMEGTIFAKLTPLQKAQIVRVLKNSGHIVGFLGDGINDAPALKESDVGISVDDGVDVAKESADVILLEKSLMVLVDGVIEGRRTYGNTIKYIKMAVSGNFGNVFSLLVASLYLDFYPMKPIHLVIQNMLYDFSQIAIPWDEMDADYLMAPKRWSAKSIIKFMLVNGPISSIIDIITFVYLKNTLDCKEVGKDSKEYNCEREFQTSWFLLGLCTQTIIVHMIRTDKIPIIQSRPAVSLVLSSLVAISGAFIIACTPVNRFTDMTTPRSSFFGFMVGMIVAYITLSQLAKMAYIRIFREWL